MKGPTLFNIITPISHTNLPPKSTNLNLSHTFKFINALKYQVTAHELLLKTEKYPQNMCNADSF